ncbi:glutamate--cysteine ligase [Ehrlichia ruminantium]|uniref:glutamate--cysteine ligase n=1 Tax=Ehrlichia ruminantium TaxID=779 RepID=UPI00079FDE1A|nr:glutamate--cysteine ligase [Ehrlichia ruminantium]KYW95015.1 glutamate--cysteine ligase [Ehrlichia ruminantium]QLK50155.1 glutamate--cysteine ligase [Ehrlichia ruminantium]QLK51080.1 glutamate--cysteine ligase [Ehrlichia ruminantium]QLK58415.1 glutamate--cysteine ligase [Ehrlichia ruminantium]
MTKIINTLGNILKKHRLDIENWFLNKFNQYHGILNVSVDLRVSKYKIAPVDTNVFPAGYNNFSEQSRIYTAELLKRYITRHLNCDKILIVGESHTRNIKYIDSLVTLKNIVSAAGFIAEIGVCDTDQNVQLISSNGVVVDSLCLTNCDGVLRSGCGFIPDLILVNNDLTSGIPKVLQSLKYQSVMPALSLGWYNRSKFNHFSIYQKLSVEFCNTFNIDPWLISTLFSSCDNICFLSNSGVEHIADKVDVMIQEIRNKFQLYSITEQPYVFVKADNGTYGMGIIVAYCGDDILKLNKKNRNKMKRIKDRKIVERVIIQEGIMTEELFNGYTAEPLVYFIGDTPSCYLYRYNTVKDKFSNLNSVGCDFVDVSFREQEGKIFCWSMVAKMAALAAAVEVFDR